jgi:hypothetical protein
MTKTLNNPGAKPELKWIALDKLYVDHNYQRNTKSKASERNLDSMKADFKWVFCGALMVCWVASQKKYAVIDGQHRLQAALWRKDIDSLPCLIISEMDVEKQAKSFVAINTKRVQLNSLAAFHAAVAAGDKSAMGIKEILDDCKIEIPRNPLGTHTGPRQMQSPGTLASLIGRYSRKHICWALNIIPEAYGEKPGMMRAQLIKALTQFAKANPILEHDRMLKVLSGLDPMQLEADARSYVTIGGGTTLSAMVEAITRLYKNAGRKNAA